MVAEFNQDSGSKTKLVNDMISLMQKLFFEFDKIDNKSKSIFNNLRGTNSVIGGMSGGGASGGGSRSIASGGGTFSGGFSSKASGVMGLISAAGSAVLGIGASIATMMPTVQEAVSSQLLTSQAKFTGMQGNVNATVRAAMGQGTASSSSDLQQAIAQGAAGGVLPGLPGYKGILNGVAQISNLTGSFQSAMQATTSLNSAGSVNTLRMMGIQVRGANGAERNPAAVFKDIWDFAVAQTGGRLNASNMAISLQPGNGLYNLLQAASAGDPNLFNALQNAAIQFSKGGSLSRASTTHTGQTTKALNSQSDLYASQFGLTAAAQNAEAKGFLEANHLLVKVTDKLSHIVSSSAAAAWALKQLAKGETLAGSKAGQAGGGIMASIGGFLKKAAPIAGAFFAGEALDPLGGGFVTAAIASGVLGGGSTGGLGQGATVKPQTAVPKTSAGAVSAVVSAGYSLVGTPYSWGGGSIQGPTRGTQQGSGTVGFDCSSFVQYAYAKIGVMLPRTTYAQVNCGVAIQPTQAQPGDLLFFGNPTSPDHVAIYLGGNKLIQAPQTGQVISTAGVDLNSVSACRRVVGGATGTAINSNLLNGTKGDPTSSLIDLSGMLQGLMGGAGGSVVSKASLMGSSPKDAMSGGSGMGQGSDSGSYSSSSTSMVNTYLAMNTKTGSLEVASPGSPIHNYGGVNINVYPEKGSHIDEHKLATAIRKEFVSIGINARVAST